MWVKIVERRLSSGKPESPDCKRQSELRSAHDTEMEALTGQCQMMVAGGASKEEMLAFLHRARSATSGPWPDALEAMLVVRRIYSLELREAYFVILEDPTGMKRHVGSKLDRP